MDDVKGTPCASNRFVPASQLDFSRYAKNLAWLLGVKLQAAQELLSQIYGYEHLHELQQVLKGGLQPGPFWDDGPSEHKDQTGVLLLAGMPGERSMRPVQVLCAWKAKQGLNWQLEKNEALIVELGLTDSPASHRDCVRRVKSYLGNEYSADAHGYPTGFWSFLARYKFGSIQDEQTTVKKLLEASGTDEDSWSSETHAPTSYAAQLTCFAMSRAVDAFGELGKLIPHEEVDWDFAFDEDQLGWGSMWEDLSNRGQWGDPWQDDCADFVFRSGEEDRDQDEHDEQNLERLRQFVEWPSEAKLKACSVALSFKEAVERVSRWRLGWMMAAVSQWQSCASRVLKLTGSTWQRDDSGFPVRDPDFASLVMKNRRGYFEDTISLTDVLGSFIIERPDGAREIGGIVHGWHFAPRAEYHSDFEEVSEFLQDYELLGKGWQVVRQYMAIRGITEMKHWLDSDEGCAMTLLTMKLAPGLDNDETRARFIRLIEGCFDADGPYQLTDDACFGPEIPWMETLYEGYEQTDDLTIYTPGLIVVAMSGIEGVGFSIADDDGEGRQIMVSGGSRGRENRAMNRRFGQPVTGTDSEFDVKRTRVRKLLEKVGDTEIDVAVLDLAADA
jgi:hypothetical protein